MREGRILNLPSLHYDIECLAIYFGASYTLDIIRIVQLYRAIDCPRSRDLVSYSVGVCYSCMYTYEARGG